jgi:KDO2-lipid IV(A) lauroyltransferase
MKKLSDLCVKALSYFILLLPMRAQLWLGDAIGFLWFDILRIRRKVALQNLTRAFPNWSLEQKTRVARLSVNNLGRTFIEFLRIPALQPKDWIPHFVIEGREHLDAALKKNKGVFLLTAHIGNGDWATVGLALHGISIHIITKEFRWAFFNRLWFETRSRFGTQYIPDRQSSLTILKALKQNATIVFVLDQFLGPPIGIETNFFGHKTGTPMGLALLAGRAGAAVIPTVTHRLPDGRTCVTFQPEIPFVEYANKEETIQKMTQIYCDKIEEWVRKYPDQWMWVHRRWKKFIDHRKLQKIQAEARN